MLDEWQDSNLRKAVPDNPSAPPVLAHIGNPFLGFRQARFSHSGTPTQQNNILKNLF